MTTEEFERIVNRLRPLFNDGEWVEMWCEILTSYVIAMKWHAYQQAQRMETNNTW